MTLQLALWIALKTLAACLVLIGVWGLVTLAIVGWLTLKQRYEFGKK